MQLLILFLVLLSNNVLANCSISGCLGGLTDYPSAISEFDRDYQTFSRNFDKFRESDKMSQKIIDEQRMIINENKKIIENSSKFNSYGRLKEKRCHNLHLGTPGC